MFGDDRADHQEAIDRHYDSGPPADWPQRFVSAYATMHPLEDCAETFAHYLHIRDAPQTAAAHARRDLGQGDGEHRGDNDDEEAPRRRNLLVWVRLGPRFR